MSANSMTTTEELAPDLTPAQIQLLIAERKRVGATNCTVVTEDGQRLLVCEWPPL